MMQALTNVEAVTPNDTTTIRRTEGIYVGVSGDLSVVMAGVGASTAIFLNVQAGTFLPISVAKVKATGTTATNILALR